MVTLALALVLTAAVNPACPPERRVEVSPQAWKAQLNHARPADYEAVLRHMRLRTFLAGYEHIQLTGVDLLPAHLVGTAEQDWVVVARFSAQAAQTTEGLSDRLTLYRIQVLTPAGRAWCAAGDDLSLDQPDEAPNAGPADGMHDAFGGLDLRLVRLTSAAHDTLEVTQTTERVSRISGKYTSHEFWDVRGGALAPVLSLDESDEHSPFFGDYHRRRKWFTLSSEPPRQVRLFEQYCEPEEPDAGPACAPVEEQQMIFTDGDYGQPTPVQPSR